MVSITKPLLEEKGLNLIVSFHVSMSVHYMLVHIFFCYANGFQQSVLFVSDELSLRVSASVKTVVEFYREAGEFQ